MSSFQATVESPRPTIQPQKGPQWTFLSSSADVAVYGGAAGGGKTWALLIEPLRHIHNPGFRGVIFRRTYPQITVEGGLWDESATIYPHVGGKPIQGDLEWRFPSGATISFRHLQHEATKYDWQGSQVPYFGFDELTHYTESQFTYVAFSRGRSTCGVKPYVRATCNPDPGWVKRFLAPWVDRESPERSKSGEVRWFIREGGQIQWVPRGTPDAKSLSFIKASVYDNRILLTRNPEYLSSLKALLPVERARLLDGDWDVRREGLVYPEFDSCVVDAAPDQPSGIGGIDFGFNNPFAAVWGFLDHDDVLWITGCRYKSHTTLPLHSEALPRGGIRWWCDPARPDSITELRVAGHDAVPCVHRGPKPILTGVDRVSERIRSGRLKVVRSTCAPLITEAGLYHYDPEKRKEEPVDDDNHAMDSMRYLVTGIDRGRAVPSVHEPEQLAADHEARQKVEADRLQSEAHERDRKAQDDIDDPRWWQS